VETIVKQHGGYERAANRRDAKGAEFTIVLPSKPQAIPARAS
jgi:signal transduction histidine kinase